MTLGFEYVIQCKHHIASMKSWNKLMRKYVRYCQVMWNERIQWEIKGENLMLRFIMLKGNLEKNTLFILCDRGKGISGLNDFQNVTHFHVKLVFSGV